MDFKSLIAYKALHQRYSAANSGLVDMVLNDPDQDHARLGLKKLQFAVSPQLFQEVDQVCQYLGMSKREFLEALVADGVEEAHKSIQELHADPESLGYTSKEA